MRKALPCAGWNISRTVRYITLSTSRHKLRLDCQAWTLKSPAGHPFPLPPCVRSHSDIQAGNDESWNSTIYALSTAPGRAGIAIIRISGPESTSIYHHLCPSRPLPAPRKATIRHLYRPFEDPSPSSKLDSSALVLFFPGPSSATGEDVLELHVHGGSAIVRAVLSAISVCSKNPASPVSLPSSPIRYADPGEFTRRAFFNNRLDLTQVEALSDSLSAETEQQRKLAVRGAGQTLGLQYESWRRSLLAARGELEALIDFSEDQHFDESPAELMENVSADVQGLRERIVLHVQNAVRGELLRSGIAVSLLGAPNAGKSSLLNCLVGREAAIVSQEAGTTRDVIEVSVDIGGYLCRFGDTAGLRRALGQEVGQVEVEGIKRAKQQAANSDLVIIVLSFEHDVHHRPRLNIDPEIISSAHELKDAGKEVIVVVNKEDLITSTGTYDTFADEIIQALPQIGREDVQFISCRPSDQASVIGSSGSIQSLLNGLLCKFGKMTSALSGAVSEEFNISGSGGSAWEESLGATERQRGLLEECLGYLDLFLVESQATMGFSEHAEHTGLEQEVDFVLAAEHLRSAASCLAKITGRDGAAGDVEDVLGVVFEKFCVGK